MIKDIIKENMERFEAEYKKAYKGILSDEVLASGNSWFTDFLLSSQLSVLRGVVEMVVNKTDKGDYSGKQWPKETQIEVDGWNGAIRDITESLEKTIEEMEKI